MQRLRTHYAKSFQTAEEKEIFLDRIKSGEMIKTATQRTETTFAILNYGDVDCLKAAKKAGMIFGSDARIHLDLNNLIDTYSNDFLKACHNLYPYQILTSGRLAIMIIKRDDLEMAHYFQDVLFAFQHVDYLLATILSHCGPKCAPLLAEMLISQKQDLEENICYYTFDPEDFKGVLALKVAGYSFSQNALENKDDKPGDPWGRCRDYVLSSSAHLQMALHCQDLTAFLAQDKDQEVLGMRYEKGYIIG